jgi:predicted ArsR family transcriptional regulator
MAGFDEDVSSIAALGEPVRRELYGYVAHQQEPVSREQAAAALGVAVHVAKFHLDRLEKEGLLEAEYSRPDGRTGPGAGRPAKLYRRTDRNIAVSLPRRQYDLVAGVLAAAITSAERTGAPLEKALARAAADAGRTLGSDTRGTATDVLAENGYEPYPTETGFALANCPFHSLAQEHTELVCGLNLDLIRSLLRAAGETGLRPRLDPAPGRCCVTLVAR